MSNSERRWICVEWSSFVERRYVDCVVFEIGDIVNVL